MSATPERGRVLLVPGNDLPPAFYRPLCERLAAGGLTATAAPVPAFLGRGPLVGWEELVGALLAGVSRHLAPGGLLVGHSLGGLLALLVAARRPAEVRSLALLEPAIPPWRVLGRRAAKAYRRRVVERDRDRFVNSTGVYRRAARPDAYPAWALELYLEARRAGDPRVVAGLLESLPGLYPLPYAAVDVPVLLLSGERSGVLAGLGARALTRCLSRAARVVVPAAAHWLVHEGEEAVARALLDLQASSVAGAPA